MVVDRVVVDDGAERRAATQRQDRLGDASDERVGAESHLDHVRDGDAREAVLLGERLEFLGGREVARRTEHRADDGFRSETREAHQVTGGLGQRRPDERPAVHSLDGRHVARHHEVGGRGVGRHRRQHRRGAIGGADAGRHAMARLDRRAVGGRRARDGTEEGNPELPHAGRRKDETHEAAGVGNEEVDPGRRHPGCGTGEHRFRRFDRGVDDEDEVARTHARQAFVAPIRRHRANPTAAIPPRQRPGFNRAHGSRNVPGLRSPGPAPSAPPPAHRGGSRRRPVACRGRPPPEPHRHRE